MVLQGEGSYQYVGQMFCGIPREVFPHGQNQCPKGEMFELLTIFTRIHPRGVGKAPGLHPGLPIPRNGKLARAQKLL